MEPENQSKKVEILFSRDFKEGDYDEYIQKLTRDNMRDHFIKNFGGWSEQVSKNKILKVAKEGVVRLFFNDNNFVGYVSFNPESNDNDSILIHDIHVVKLFQRKDYGFQILNEVVKHAKKNDAKQLKVFVFKDNYAVNFYLKNDFHITEELEKSNSVIMIRFL